LNPHFQNGDAHFTNGGYNFTNGGYNFGNGTSHFYPSTSINRWKSLRNTMETYFNNYNKIKNQNQNYSIQIILNQIIH
jgi:phage pi2 protein 07